MSQNVYSEINLHFVWHVKQSLPLISEQIEPGLHRFLRSYALKTEGLIKLNELGWFEFIDQDKDANFSTNEEEGTVSILIKLQRRETKGILRELRVLNPIPAPAAA